MRPELRLERVGQWRARAKEGEKRRRVCEFSLAKWRVVFTPPWENQGEDAELTRGM